MLQIVHGRNSPHPYIMGVVSHLDNVCEGQGRRDEALAICEGNTEID